MVSFYENRSLLYTISASFPSNRSLFDSGEVILVWCDSLLWSVMLLMAVAVGPLFDPYQHLVVLVLWMDPDLCHEYSSPELLHVESWSSLCPLSETVLRWYLGTASEGSRLP